MTVAKAKDKAIYICHKKNYSAGFTYDRHNNFIVQAIGVSLMVVTDDTS